MDKVVFSKPKLLNDTPLHYCPGCTHGIVHRLIAEALEEIGDTENVIGIAPVGCIGEKKLCRLAIRHSD